MKRYFNFICFVFIISVLLTGCMTNTATTSQLSKGLSVDLSPPEGNSNSGNASKSNSNINNTNSGRSGVGNLNSNNSYLGLTTNKQNTSPEASRPVIKSTAKVASVKSSPSPTKSSTTRSSKPISSKPTSSKPTSSKPTSSTTQKKTTKSKTLRIYFPSKTKSIVGYETRNIIPGVNNDVISATQLLLSGPNSKNLRSPFPYGCKLLGAGVDNDVAVVNLSSGLDMYSPADTELNWQSISKTFLALGNINQVKLQVNGIEVTPLKSITTVKPRAVNKTVPLYFGSKLAGKLVIEKATFSVLPTSSVEKMIINQLVNGPKNSNHLRLVPSSTKVLNIEIKDGICKLNLSKEFVQNYRTVGNENLVLYSIVNSLTEQSGIQKVEFYVENAKLTIFGALKLQSQYTKNNSLE